MNYTQTLTAKTLLALTASLATAIAAWPSVGSASINNTQITYRRACEIVVLKSAGWQIDEHAQTSSVERRGSICSNEPNEQAVGGILKLSGGSKDSHAIATALQSPLTHCLYAKELGSALDVASQGLQKNFWYWFNLPVLGSGIPRMGALKGWKRTTCPVHAEHKSAKCFDIVPGQFEEAFKSLYRGRFSTECAAGLQLTQYAGLHELFGEKMEEYFKPSEIFVSSWDDLYQSTSATYGVRANVLSDMYGQLMARQGPQMLVGLSGAIASVFDESYLNSKINRNENFVIVSASAAGARDLAERGLGFYLNLTRVLWENSRAFSKSEISKIAENKPVSHDLAKADRITEILNEPFLRDTIVRVHPKGNWPLAKHFVRLLKINPRTPYLTAFYASNLHTDIYQRWLKMRIDRCSDLK